MRSTMANTLSANAPGSAQRFSTGAFAPHERVAAWREAYGATIAKLEFEPTSEGPFTVEATLRSLPGLGIATMSTQGLRFAKPRNLIDSDDLILVMMESGGYSGSQLGRDVKLGPGDAVIRWNAEVTSGEIFGRPSLVRVPTRAIAPLVSDVSAAVQRRIPADTDALRLLAPYVRAMQHCGGTPEVQRIAASHVHDLIALLLGATRDATEVARDRGQRAARLRGIKEDIAVNLEHGDISIAAVATRHRVTPRTVQKLFEHDGTTFTEYVLEQRLVLSHRILSDPKRAAEKIAVVAFTAGFGDVSYFYRAFRRRYGVLPTDVRAQALRLN
jgi:AraC-like DNA-binding protein